MLQGRSTIGSALVSKTRGCEFDSHRPCFIVGVTEIDERVAPVETSWNYPASSPRQERQRLRVTMAKEKTVGSPSLLNEMVQANRYKRTQGKIARQATLISIWVLISIAAYQLYQQLEAYASMAQYRLHLLLPIALVVVGFWVAYRLINWPTFADFLIAVEAEMNKVTWPSKAELWRSVIVVIALIFILALLLFAFDLLWITLFKTIGLIPPDTQTPAT